MKQPLTMPVASYAIGSNLRTREAREIVATELVTFQNRLGKRLVGYYDHPSASEDDERWMIVLPGYGESKTDVLPESYFLARNGFHAIRFDYSDHVGESDGEILKTSVEGMKEDILSCVEYLYTRFSPVKLGAVASSLAARALLRAARQESRIQLLVNLVHVVDLRKTLFAIYQEDYINLVQDGVSAGVMDVLGFQVDADHFLRSAIENRYEDLSTTLEDMRHIHAPVVFFAAEKDAWVELNDVIRAVYAVPGRRHDLQILNGAMHELYENPRTSRETLQRIVQYAVSFLSDSRKTKQIVEPNLKEVAFRARKEKKRNRLIHAVGKSNEREFWKSYLDKYSFVVNVPDYWDLMNLVYSLLGELKSHDKILDAGCGIGNFGTFLLVKLLYSAKQQPVCFNQFRSSQYVGIDFVGEALIEAVRIQREIRGKFAQSLELAPDNSVLAAEYILSDLDSGLPFIKDSFHKICCNLVLSYVERPVDVVRDMARVLQSGGKIVVTSLKPFPDLSQVYRNFLQVAKGKSEIEEARKLLTNAGRVKSKEAQGIYEFLSEESLVKILKDAGFLDIETFRSLGNQANVAVGSKA